MKRACMICVRCEAFSCPSRLSAFFQGELQDPALLHEAEFLFSGQPANAHMMAFIRFIGSSF